MDDYDDVITEMNRTSVEKLNNLAALANRVLSRPETARYITGVAKAAHYVIYGEVARFSR